jgi:hypothetical protein
MFRFKPGSQFVERYHRVVSCALKISFRAVFFFNSVGNEEISNVFLVYILLTS